MAIGKPLAKLPDWGSKPKRTPTPEFRRAKGAKLKVSRSLNYAKIKAGVMEAIARLPSDKRALIPAAGTLPEQMACLALVWLGWLFQAQVHTDGGRIRLGGAVVDIKVWMGSSIIVVRVQGDYWHSLPARQYKDQVQWHRLHALGFRVADMWEHDLYRAWVEGRLKQFVEAAILNAA